VILRVVRVVRRRLLGGPPPGDYRAYLFEELVAYLGGRRPKRILEIGPKDGQNTQRLLTLDPERLTLLDLPRLEASNRVWLDRFLEYVSANLMYSETVSRLEPFDVVWCTGVLYHNPEQLRMVRRLADLVKPGGVLVLESATTRRPRLRAANCVEVLYPPSEAVEAQVPRELEHHASALGAGHRVVAGHGRARAHRARNLSSPGLPRSGAGSRRVPGHAPADARSSALLCICRRRRLRDREGAVSTRG
jgi:SAM-dependent methyltransferase